MPVATEDGPESSRPSVVLPKGGGAIKGIGEKFAANPVTGTGSVSVPLAVSPGRSGFGPTSSLRYDSGAGNGAFGFGWSHSLPMVTRKTDKGLPRYTDDPEDTFILSGAEDLVPELEDRGRRRSERRAEDGREYTVLRYRPRIEGLFARIERWTDLGSGEAHWRSVTGDNVTTVYGKDAGSRIADPADPRRVFSWLICQSHDDKGNIVVYEYKAEDSDGVDLTVAHERNRGRSANRYLKRIRYGNRVSRLVEPDPSQDGWMFEVVLDYGEHDQDDPHPGESRPWPCRRDPFSSYRAGFEVRTYRLCRRVLMFHHFPDEDGVGRNCLTRSTDLRYREDPVASFVESVVQSGYRRHPDGGYRKKSLPPLEFRYTEAVIDEKLHTVEDVENLPTGLDDSAYQWVDLDGEGVSGVLTEQANGWFYKENLGDAHFGPLRQVTAVPSTTALRGQQLVDLAGDGQLDLVDFDSVTPGFFERTQDAGWEPFKAFRSLPNLDWDNPNLRLVDLTGDGHADVLVTEDDVFSWYPSLAEEGFAPARHVHPTQDEEHGPRLLLADREQSIHLADMSGDGLTDLVRIRNGEVCYWPSLGYGRFGPKVTMADAPWFDEQDQFDQRRVRIADVDGSGATDIIYLHRSSVRIYRNAAGNGWLRARALPFAVTNTDTVSTVDLFGNGTACLVWSSPLPSEAGRPLRYVDLMGGQKPHLLVRVRNNLGAETHVQYAPSTKFYLADKKAGRPWITRLPFPVHVVERVETVDRISRNRFVTRYAYHHGYFDGVEREFNGFGMVEQWDTESFAALDADATNVDEASHVPPVLTRTWFHTGAFLDRDRISRLFEGEYHQDLGDLVLPDTVLPDLPLSLDEQRQACRALKGSVLRQEIYALDGSEAAVRPYTVSERNYTVKLLQPAADDDAVFFVHPRESLTAHHERKLYPVGDQLRPDPRVSHDLVLTVDDYGNVLRSVSVGYGRDHRDPDPTLTDADHERQHRTHVVYSENDYTNPIDQPDAYRTPLQCETRQWEILGLTPDVHRPGATSLFGFDELVDELGSISHELSYEEWDADPAGLTAPSLRLTEHVRILYRRDDLTGPLPLGVLEPLALPFESYHLAFTPSLLTGLYGERVDDALLAETGGYVRHAAHDGWWIPTGRVFYSSGAADPPDAELAYAREHFFMPQRFQDPFRAVTSVTYDGYDLLTQQLRDPVDNMITAGERDTDGQLVTNGNDYRVLQARLVMDANRNRAEVAFDTLGMVVANSVMGKPEEHLGDTLDGFDADPDEDLVARYLGDPLADPHRLLQGATTRLVYDLFAYQRTEFDEQPQPPVVATLARETHVSDLADGVRTKIQHSFSYSDAFGREIQKKVQAEPGPLTDDGTEINPRWVGTGWTIFNNKAKPVRKYEPFFSATHRFEFAMFVGVSPVLFYDPVDRVVATLHPDDTWEKVVFDPWHQASWDANDTVLTDPRQDADVGGYVGRYLAGQGEWRSWYAQRINGDRGPAERVAAEKTAGHAATAARQWLDSLNRTFLSLAHNRFPRDGAMTDEFIATRTHVDVEGNERAAIDGLGRCVMRYGYTMTSIRVAQSSMEAGEHLMLDDVSGKPIYSWNSRGFRVRTEYDALRRPLRAYVVGGELAEEILHERTVYGENLPDDHKFNLRGRPSHVYDTAGVSTTEAYDFAGNPLSAKRALVVEYHNLPDWSAEVALEERTYLSGTRYDALRRPTELSAPDGSLIRPTYKEANLLDRLEISLQGSGEWTPVVSDTDYNVRGQRSSITYGNGVRTDYHHDPTTFRLTRLRTSRGNAALQDLGYTYDPAGNITRLEDHAQHVVFFRNRRIEPSADYTYDAIYRLVEATGREHLGQTGDEPQPSSPDDSPRIRLAHAHDGEAMGRYVQRYVYDAVGNILSMEHRGHRPDRPGWTRGYRYLEPSLLEPDKVSNRLSGTATVEDEPFPRFGYDAHGNITATPELPLVRWDFKDQLSASSRQVVHDPDARETTYYVYDATGQRVRKITERHTRTRKSERIYVGGFEVYREYGSGGVVALERETLHVLDDKQRVALIETRTIGTDESLKQLLRFQIGNHLGSATLELDAAAEIISYEEYYPHGATSYQAVRGQTETPKRYRYTGKERDEESGLYYHGARYYAPWLGRWMSCDPIGIQDADNLYQYSGNRPVGSNDPTGMWEMPSWRTVAVITAVVVVSVAVTVITAGVAGPAIAAGATAFAGTIGLGATGAAVVSGVAVGAVAGAAGGLASGVVGETTRQAVNSQALGLGSGEFSGTAIARSGAEGLLTGAVGGAVTGGLAGGLTNAARGGAMGARLATHAVSSGNAAVPTVSRAASAAIGVGRHARNAAIGAASGGTGSAASELVRQGVNGEQLDVGKIGSAAKLGAVLGGAVPLGVAGVRGARGALTRGQVRALSNDPKIQANAYEASELRGSIPNNRLVLNSHGRAGRVEINGSRGRPIAELAPIIEANPSRNVTIRACSVAQDPGSVRALAENTGRTITAYSDPTLANINYMNPSTRPAGSTVPVPATPTTFVPDTNLATHGLHRELTIGLTVSQRQQGN
jgi:RHS repeat-associated protein